MAENLYVGLMSGTSVDGIDAALVAIPDHSPFRPRLLHARFEAMPPGLRERILAICLPADNEIDRLGMLDVELGEHFAASALELLREAGVAPARVRAIGSHGQTVRHRPGKHHPFTLQIGDAHVIAERTGITTVADFRRRDIAAGGQGAPLVPAFHDAVFSEPGRARMVVNIGGMANVTWLPGSRDEGVNGFDTGPGNVLLDAWHERHRGHRFDRDGAWAASGRIHDSLLARLLADPYFKEPPPKSTGRERFSIDWIDEQLALLDAECTPADVQATLAEVTARSIADAIRARAPAAEVFLCGGGAHNSHLRHRIGAALPDCRVASTDAIGIDPDWVEAMAFAWLAHSTLEGKPGNLPAVTGARRAVVLGAIHPAFPGGKAGA